MLEERCSYIVFYPEIISNLVLKIADAFLPIANAVFICSEQCLRLHRVILLHANVLLGTSKQASASLCSLNCLFVFTRLHDDLCVLLITIDVCKSIIESFLNLSKSKRKEKKGNLLEHFVVSIRGSPCVEIMFTGTLFTTVYLYTITTRKHGYILDNSFAEVLSIRIEMIFYNSVSFISFFLNLFLFL